MRSPTLVIFLVLGSCSNSKLPSGSLSADLSIPVGASDLAPPTPTTDLSHGDSADLALTPDLAPRSDLAQASTCGVAGLPCCSPDTGSGCNGGTECARAFDGNQTKGQTIIMCVPTSNTMTTCNTYCANNFAPSQTAQIAACNAACVGACGGFEQPACVFAGYTLCGWCDPQTTSCPIFSSSGAGYMETGGMQGVSGCAGPLSQP